MGITTLIQFCTSPGDRNMIELLTRDTFMKALNNPRLKDKVQVKEPVTFATGTHQCHETEVLHT